MVGCGSDWLGPRSSPGGDQQILPEHPDHERDLVDRRLFLESGPGIHRPGEPGPRRFLRHRGLCLSPDDAEAANEFLARLASCGSAGGILWVLNRVAGPPHQGLLFCDRHPVFQYHRDLDHRSLGGFDRRSPGAHGGPQPDAPSRSLGSVRLRSRPKSLSTISFSLSSCSPCWP